MSEYPKLYRKGDKTRVVSNVADETTVKFDGFKHDQSVAQRDLPAADAATEVEADEPKPKSNGKSKPAEAPNLDAKTN